MSYTLSFILLGQLYFIGAVLGDSSTNCPGGVRADYTYIPGIGSHKVHSTADNWSNARRICQQEGGDLAVIKSKAEAIIVGQLLQAALPHEGSEWSEFGHIGFNDLFEEGRYVTVDGHPLSETGYLEWFTGEPNNGGGSGGLTDDCGAIHNDGRLADSNCIRKYAFVCKLSLTV